METRSMPTIIALLTLYAIRYAVTRPPAIMPSHICTRSVHVKHPPGDNRLTVFDVILWLTHIPSTKNSSGHPAICNGVERAPETAPIPVVLPSPIKARKSPIPQAAAIFKDTGITLTSPMGQQIRGQCVVCRSGAQVMFTYIAAFRSAIGR